MKNKRTTAIGEFFISIAKAIWNIIKSIGLFFFDFIKRVGDLFVNFAKFTKNAAIGPSFSFYDKKHKTKDPNRFVFYISLIASIILFLIIRSPSLAVNDFISFFNLYLIIPVVIGLALSIPITILVTKKKYTCVLEGIHLFITPIFIYAFIQEIFYFNVNSTNWFLWLIMSIPFIINIFSNVLFCIRAFMKLIRGRISPERENDFIVRKRENKKIFRKFGLYLKHNWGQILIVIAITILAISVLLPLCVLLMRSIKVSIDDLKDPYAIPTRFTFDHYSYMWNYLQNAYFNSLITTIGVTVGTVILASLLAFAFVRFKFPLKNVLFYAIIGLMMIPGILTLISRYQLVSDMNLLGTLSGIILPGIAGYIPAGFMLLFTFFKGIPNELFEAADVDGATDFKAFTKITVPLSKPILCTIAIQTFVGEWNDYLWASLIIGSDETKYTLPVLLKRLSDSYADRFLAMSAPFAGYVLSAIPLVLIFIVASKQFIEGLTSGAFKM